VNRRPARRDIMHPVVPECDGMHISPQFAVVAAVAVVSLLAYVGEVRAAGRQSRAPAQMKVFLDGDDCFADFLRSETEFVDYVRDRTEAEVHACRRVQRLPLLDVHAPSAPGALCGRRQPVSVLRGNTLR
jgi:hypothetical protein